MAIMIWKAYHKKKKKDTTGAQLNGFFLLDPDTLLGHRLKRGR
jgi:hypothetical protein